MKKVFLTVLAAMVALSVYAQLPTGGIKGTLISRAGRQPIQNANLLISKDGKSVSMIQTGADGYFEVDALADGIYNIKIIADGFNELNVNATVDKGFVKDMVFLSLNPVVQRDDVDEASISEFDLDDSGYNDNPTLLYSSNDPYNSIASFGFSNIRFKNRGYNSETQDVYFAGVRLNDAVTGYSPFSLWTGLNEVTRAKENTTGLESSEYGAGGYNGSTNIMGTPSNVRKGLRVSALTNSALYRMRLMLTYGSGPLDNGWSYAVSASARLGGNDWVQGVYYRSFAYYLGAEKVFGNGSRFAFLTFATPGERGAQNASTQEVYNLMGDNMYNSNWGYQNGKARNSRVRKTFEPVTVLKYTCNPSETLEASTTFLWRTGFNGYTALDWYDAADPRPDYYRNLPSYSWGTTSDGDDQSVRYDYTYNDLNEKGQWMYSAWTEEDSPYRHLNWDHLYQVNYASAGGRSKYALEERHVDQNDFNLVQNFKWMPSESFTLMSGFGLRYNRTEYYKKMADLLGGEYFLDVDSFAERDFAVNEAKIQNDLDYFFKNGHAREIHVGDKYGYDYFAHVVKANAWFNLQHNLGVFEYSLAGKVGYDGFQRQGMMRKGLFPGISEGQPFTYNDEIITVYDADGNVISSKGNSAFKQFLVGNVKAYASFNIAQGQRIYANAGFFADAPTFNEAFISPRTRNTMIDGLKDKLTFSADLNYQLSHKGYNVRATAYYTKVMNQTDVMSFYDDSQNSFTNFAMTGIDQRHMGIELGFKVPLPVSGLSVGGALSMGEHIYTSNPHMVQTVDNSAEIVRNEDVPYWKGVPVYSTYEVDEGHLAFDENKDGLIVKEFKKHYVPSTPQIGAQLSLNYNINYWFFELNGQFFAKSYLDMNPLYRTNFALKGCFDADGKLIYNDDQTKGGSAHFYYMTEQEAFDPVFLLNASVGKSWFVKGNQIGFSLSLNNLTNNTGVKTGGYEQTRLQNSSDKSIYNRFASKYFYMPGFNYMLNVYFRF